MWVGTSIEKKHQEKRIATNYKLESGKRRVNCYFQEKSQLLIPLR